MKSYLYSPGGNPTLLIENLDNKLTKSQKLELSKKALSKNQCEQVAFIQKTKSGLFKCQMMGNELCINALRSVGAWVNSTTGQTTFLLASSGTKEIFKIEASKQNVQIEINPKFKLTKFDQNIDLVELEGIAHFTLKANRTFSKNSLTQRLKQFIAKNPIIKTYPAIGLISYKKINKENLEIQPLVFVKETNSYILESACGSGSIAVAIVEQTQQTNIMQPSGQIYNISKNGSKIRLDGEVTLMEAKII